MFHFLGAILLFLQDSSARETLKKLEEAIVTAKTVRFKVLVEAAGKVEGQDFKSTASGSVFFKEGNRILMTLNAATKTKFVSDGIHCSYWSGGLVDANRKIVDTLGNLIRSGIVRLGMTHFQLLLPRPPESKPLLKAEDMEKLFFLSEFAFGQDDQALKTITFTLKTADEEEGADHVRIWYDPKTYLPRKRVSTQKSKDSEYTTTETYHEMTLNAEIPEETFKLTEK